MLLTEIAGWVNLGTNNQVSPEQVCMAMDAIQKNVFQRNQQAFLVYDKILTIWQGIQFVDAGYVSAIESDIGKPVVSTGVTGTLKQYDNDEKIWYVETDDAFTASAAVTITGGTGTGTLEAEKFQWNFRGPYFAPDSPPCRKIWGVTKKSPGKFWLDYLGCGWGFIYSIDGIWQTNDYRALWGNRLYPFVTGNTFDLDNSFLFSFDPGRNHSEHPYRWVYWKNPPNITGLDDSSTLLIPSAYHFNLAKATKEVVQVFLQDQGASIDKIVDDNLGSWVDTLLAPFRSEWRASNMTQQRSPGWI